MLTDFITISTVLYSGKGVNRQMGETSHHISRQNSQQPKHFRGGEKKVMKKSLSLLLSIALVFSMFASMASANELSTQDKFDQLKEAGIFQGYEDGSAGLDKDMKRSHFAVVLQRLLDLEDADHSYTDISASTNSWAGGAIGAVTEAGLMEGKGAGKFDAEGYVKVEELAAIALRALGFDEVEGEVAGKVDSWAAGYVAAALELGLIPAQADYTVFAKRGQLVDVAYEVLEAIIGSQITVTSAVVIDEKTVEVTLSNEAVVKVELETALKPGEKTTISFEHEGKKYEVEVELASSAIASITQTGAKVLTVKFNRTLTAAEKADLTYDVALGTLKYSVTAKYADDNKSVELAADYLPAGEYDVTVKGFDAVKVTVAAEVATKLEIGASEIQKDANTDLLVKVLNQFGEQITTAVPTITAFSSVNADISSKVVNGVLSLPHNTATPEVVGTTIVITALYPSAGLSLSKTYTVVAQSVASSLELGTVAPLSGTERITVGDKNLVLPYKIVDQYGKEIKLPQPTNASSYVVSNGKATVGPIDLIVSPAINIDEFYVDADGVLTFDADVAGTVVITALNAASGKSSTTTVTINSAAALKELKVLSAAGVIVKGEKTIFNYSATDSFGAPIAKTSVPASVTALGNNFQLNIAGVPATHSFKANGDLEVVFNGSGTATITVLVNGLLTSTLTVTVNDEAYPVSIKNFKGLKAKAASGAVQSLTIGQLDISDNFGRAYTELSTGWNLSFSSSDSNIAAVAGGNVTAGNTKGKATITATLTGPSTTLTKTFTFEVVADSAITSYVADAVGTIYKSATNGYAKTISLTGKTATNEDVAINTAQYVNVLTTNNSSAVVVPNASGLEFYGVAAGTATVTAWKSGVKLADVTVTVSEATPVVTSVSFDSSELEPTGTVDLYTLLNVVDQYGVEWSKDGTTGYAQAGGFWYSSDNNVASVGNTNGILTLGNSGIATITYINGSGLSATITVYVN